MIERRVKTAKFPATKSLDSFDFKAIPSLNKALTMELARCECVNRVRTLSHWARAAPARPTLRWGSGVRPVRRV